MKIKFGHLLQGAQQAEGITVIIDVFRAFTLEPYLFHAGISRCIAVDTLERARELKKLHPDYILFGERQGIVQQGFDHGNSPYYTHKLDLQNITAVHASSSGTRGLVAAMGSSAQQVLTGSFVNAAAIAAYIKKAAPQTVTLVDMGWAGQRPTLEDTICAEYIASLLTDTAFTRDDYIYEIFKSDGERFFLPENKDSMPSEDFFFALRKNIFNFVLKAEYDENKDVVLHKIMV